MTTQQEIAAAADAIRAGRLVAFPTETVYGLGANALDPVAVAAIFELKQRPKFDPLIVHISDAVQLADLATDVPEVAAELIGQFWPGPLSLVLSKRDTVPDIVTAGLPSVAIRCPAHPVAQQLIRSAKVPIAAPSANRFGMVSPTTADHVLEQFRECPPMVLDAGPCEVGVESTVISFVETLDGRPTLLRHGGIPQESIEAVVGPIETGIVESTCPTSPGQLAKHYSPRTPLTLATVFSECKEPRVGLLSFQRPPSTAGYASIEILSEGGCVREAAANLFSAMRRLDAIGLDRIVALPVPEIDLGRAIMDRLRRAAAR